jgi:hypothetical protein
MPWIPSLTPNGGGSATCTKSSWPARSAEIRSSGQDSRAARQLPRRSRPRRSAAEHAGERSRPEPGRQWPCSRAGDPDQAFGRVCYGSAIGVTNDIVPPTMDGVLGEMGGSKESKKAARGGRSGGEPAFARKWPPLLRPSRQDFRMPIPVGQSLPDENRQSWMPHIGKSPSY